MLSRSGALLAAASNFHHAASQGAITYSALFFVCRALTANSTSGHPRAHAALSWLLMSSGDGGALVVTRTPDVHRRAMQLAEQGVRLRCHHSRSVAIAQGSAAAARSLDRLPHVLKLWPPSKLLLLLAAASKPPPQ